MASALAAANELLCRPMAFSDSSHCMPGIELSCRSVCRMFKLHGPAARQDPATIGLAAR